MCGITCNISVYISVYLWNCGQKHRKINAKILYIRETGSIKPSITVLLNEEPIA